MCGLSRLSPMGITKNGTPIDLMTLTSDGSFRREIESLGFKEIPETIRVDPSELGEHRRALVLKEHGTPGGEQGSWQAGRFALETLPPALTAEHIYTHSFTSVPEGRQRTNSTDLDTGWGAVLIPLAVGLCPTDTAGGSLEFPPGNIREIGVPGHEVVYIFAGGHPASIDALQQRGIRIGDIVIGDINIGCGFCAPCNVGRAGIFCANTLTFAGVGSDAAAAEWMRDQTGVDAAPGGYNEGFVVMPTSALTKVDISHTRSLAQLALFSQTDAVACALSSLAKLGICASVEDSFKKIHGYDSPNVLIAGSGRLGLLHGYLLQYFVPNARIFFIDPNPGNLARVGNFLGIPDDQRFHLSDRPASTQLFTKGYLGTRFGHLFRNGGAFDVIIDCAGHGTFDGPAIRCCFHNIASKGAVFVTTAHTGVARGELAELTTAERNLANHQFAFALSPQNHMGEAARFLADDVRQKGSAGLAGMISFLEGGLDFQFEHSLSEPGDDRPRDLARLVSVMPQEIKDRMEGTVFVTSLLQRPREVLDRFRENPQALYRDPAARNLLLFLRRLSEEGSVREFEF